MKRREFIKYTGATVALSQIAQAATPPEAELVPQNSVFEKSFRATSTYRDPFTDVVFSVRITFPDGTEITYLGFWAGQDRFKFRFSSPVTGNYSYATQSSNAADAGLHQQRGTCCRA